MNSNNVLNQSIDDLIEFLNSGDKQLFRPFDEIDNHSDKNTLLLDSAPFNNPLTVNQEKSFSGGTSFKKEKENIHTDILKDLVKDADDSKEISATIV